jgi:hypothetical protein
MNRTSILLLGVAAVIGATWLWHGPLGAGERLASGIEARARTMLDSFEMNHVMARVERGPLTRRVLLSGPADDFQRREIKRLVEAQPGVARASWSASSLEAEAAQ